MEHLILIADDHEETCEVTAEWLKHHGFRTEIAKTGTRALDMAQSIIPDLVLLDLMMPEMNGLEVAKRLKDDPATKGIPLIVVTASGRSEHEAHVDALGCEGLFIKPVDLKKLLEHIRNLVSTNSPI